MSDKITGFKTTYVCKCTQDIKITKGNCRDSYKKDEYVLIRIDGENIFITHADQLRKTSSSDDGFRFLTYVDPRADTFIMAWGAPTNVKPADIFAIFKVDEKESRAFRKHLAIAQKNHADQKLLTDKAHRTHSANKRNRLALKKGSIYALIIITIYSIHLAIATHIPSTILLAEGVTIIICLLHMFLYSSKDEEEQEYKQSMKNIREKTLADNAYLDAVRAEDGWYYGDDR